ncbi:hypothetical protein [Eubacterium sp.]|uniref:hypothetical protein n=1 Tax=Eubacterium sp. TaxID=142586 RepID=UPI0030DD36BA
MKNLSPELRAYKTELDFLFKKMGELEWELATVYLGKKAVRRSEVDLIREQLENYQTNVNILLEKVRGEVQKMNAAGKK